MPKAAPKNTSDKARHLQDMPRPDHPLRPP